MREPGTIENKCVASLGLARAGRPRFWPAQQKALYPRRPGSPSASPLYGRPRRHKIQCRAERKISGLRRRRKAAKSRASIAIVRKLAILANALLRDQREWTQNWLDQDGYSSDGDLARLDAAMTFLDALCARNIRRRPSQGGRPPKAILMLLASSGCKLGLIAFDREEIMALGVADVAANLALRENRVASDDRSFARQSLQKRHRRRDFVDLWRDDEVADHRRKPGREGGSNMQRLVVEPPAAAQRFAVILVTWMVRLVLWYRLRWRTGDRLILGQKSP